MLAHIQRLGLWFFFFNVVFTISPLVFFLLLSLHTNNSYLFVFFFPKALLITGLSSHMCHIQIKYRCSFTVGNNHFRDGKQTRILITRKKAHFLSHSQQWTIFKPCIHTSICQMRSRCCCWLKTIYMYVQRICINLRSNCIVIWIFNAFCVKVYNVMCVCDFLWFHKFSYIYIDSY